MIKIVGHDVWRGGQKIGYFRGDRLFSHEGRELGYAFGNHVFKPSGQRVASLKGNALFTQDGRKFRLDEVNEGISGGELSDTHRAAVHLLLGE